MRPPHHRRPPSSISSASFHSFASSSTSVDRLPAYSPTDCEDGTAFRRQYPTITTVRIHDKDEDDEPLSATLKRLGAKRKTAILPRKVDVDDDDEWEDVDEQEHRPSKGLSASLRPLSRKTSSRSALSNLKKPLPTAPHATALHHSTPVPDGWGGRLTRPSWFPSHQPGPLLKTPVPQSSLLEDPRLASLLQPLPGAGKGGEAPIKAVRFASLLPSWRGQPHLPTASSAFEGAKGTQDEKTGYMARSSADQEPLPRYQQDPAWPSHEDDVGYPSPSYPSSSSARGIKSRRTLLIRTALAIIALILLLGLAIGLSSHSHSHSPSHPHSHARPSSGSATTASRIKPDVATTESTVQSATSNGGVPSWSATPTQGAPPLLVSSSPAAGKTSASATEGAPSSTAPQKAAPATPAASSTATNVIAGSHHAALVSQAVAQAVGQSQA